MAMEDVVQLDICVLLQIEARFRKITTLADEFVHTYPEYSVGQFVARIDFLANRRSAVVRAPKSNPQLESAFVKRDERAPTTLDGIIEHVEQLHRKKK